MNKLLIVLMLSLLPPLAQAQGKVSFRTRLYSGHGSFHGGYSVTIEVQNRGLAHLALRLAGALADTLERCAH